MKTRKKGKANRMRAGLFLMLFLTVFFPTLFGGIGQNAVIAEAATAAPSGLAVEEAYRQVTISWDAVPGASTYALFLKRPNGEVVLVHNRITTNSYTVPGLEDGARVGFAVKAYANGSWSGYSSTIWATPHAVAVAPKTVTTVAGDGQVTVNWDAVPGAKTYAIFLKRTSGEVILIHNRVSDTSYTVTGLPNGTAAGFVVKSYVNGQWSGWSSTAWATPKASAVPPKNVKAVPGDGKVEVSWDAVPGASKYALYLRNAAAQLELISSDLTNTKGTVTGLVNGTEVGFVLKAYVSGTWSTWSETVYTTPVAEKKRSERIIYKDSNVVTSSTNYSSRGADTVYQQLYNWLFQYNNGFSIKFRLTEDEVWDVAERLIEMKGITQIEIEELTRYPSCSNYNIHIKSSPAFKYIYAWSHNDTSKLDENEKKALAKASNLVWEAKKYTTDFEKEVFFHDYLVLNIEYNSEDRAESGQTPYGALVLGKCVCAGYASTFQLLLEMSGIDAYYISGTGNGGAHAWNKVQIGGEWYNVDATWDDPTPDVPGRVFYNYLNVTDTELAKNHTWDDTGLPKCTSTEYNYFLQKYSSFYSQEDAAAYCKERVAAGEMTVSFIYCGSGSPLQRVVNAVGRGCSYSTSTVPGGVAYTMMFK